MESSYIIGVDIGGTNTDGVLVDKDNKIVAKFKTTTTDEISVGFSKVLKNLLDNSKINPSQIQGVFLGTTHATNAILQKKDLFKVGVLRVAGQKPEALPVAYSWPQDLKQVVVKDYVTIHGGLECHGGPLTPLNEHEARQAVKKLLEQGVESIAVIGVFSPLNGAQEQSVADIVREVAGETFPVSLSNEVGGIGFIERENSTILNATLKKVMRRGFLSLQTACEEFNIDCTLMITQNDGSLIELEKAIEYPVLTISAGPTNSFIGGVKLAGLSDAIVVDIGGTSTDVGLVRMGFPVRSLNKSEIGGVSLNFPMPDVLSIGLGGGSIIDLSATIPKIGPRSVGRFLEKQAMSFGGRQFTLTDVAIAMRHLKIKEAKGQADVNTAQGKLIYDLVKSKIEALTNKIQGEYKNLPVVLVGGGAALLPKSLLNTRYIIPENFNVANAYGAALSSISGTVDTVVSLKNRESTLEMLHEEARKKAIAQGASSALLKLVDQQIIPYSYVPNQMARVIVRYCGKRSQAYSQV